jgi:hypothetical protein
VDAALGMDDDEDPVVQIEGEEADGARDVTTCLMVRGVTRKCLSWPGFIAGDLPGRGLARLASGMAT